MLQAEGGSVDYAECLKDNLQCAEALVTPLRESAGSFETFMELLTQYVKLRYMIDDTDFWSDDLRELSAFSMKHQQDTVGENTSALQDTSLNCAGATSAETKQILLLMKLRKDLGVQLAPDYIGTARSLTEVAQRLFEQL